MIPAVTPIAYASAASIGYGPTARYVDSFLPLLLPRIADPNPRMKAACSTFLIHLVDSFQDPILKLAFAPVPLTGKPQVPPKTIKARIEACTTIVTDSKYGAVNLEVPMRSCAT